MRSREPAVHLRCIVGPRSALKAWLRQFGQAQDVQAIASVRVVYTVFWVGLLLCGQNPMSCVFGAVCVNAHNLC